MVGRAFSRKLSAVVELRVPRVQDAEASYVFTGWLVPDGGRVAFGDAAAEIETSKATIELWAEGDGILQHILAPFAECQPGTIFGRIIATALDEATSPP